MPSSEASWLEVIAGSMFSGKSEELIRRVKRAVIAKQNVIVFKPALDHRYGRERVAAHNGLHIDCIPVREPEEILGQVNDDVDVVAIDEVQFSVPTLFPSASCWSEQGKGYCCRPGSGLQGEPFGSVPILMALAEQVTKLNAICVVCGRAASRTQRLIDGSRPITMIPLFSSGQRRTMKPAAAAATRCQDHRICR